MSSTSSTKPGIQLKKMNPPNRWPAEDETYLRNAYGIFTNAAIAQKLGRTVTGIEAKVKRMMISTKDALGSTATSTSTAATKSTHLPRAAAQPRHTSSPLRRLHPAQPRGRAAALPGWAGGGGGVRAVLDPCCGSRMMWLEKQDPRVIFGDRRSETITVTDRSHGKDGTRTLRIEPDVLLDFRALPYQANAFRLVAFDPPHVVRAGPRSWLAAKYGKLGKDWREDLRAGFAECFRVLEPGGVLVFKWNETQVKLREVLELAPEKPLFGQVSGRGGLTHWLVFMKTPA